MELGEATMVETTTSPKHQVHADCLQLQDSDHPTMILVTTPFNGGNYLIWSRLIQISLGAKLKLGFIDGKIPKPEKDSDEFGQWELWLELEGRFGQCSWLVLYQLQREIFTISQGNLSVLAYFTTIKRLWDELTCLMPIPNCTCGSTKARRN
ncbi:UNVERIFIED_CONTAM: hypothetical protein Sangu_1633200 [Sesamum angustifolium]|uniref:Retrotransposon Copia-like N-terminal domain-containing protein n=1 Tax=Sesamum angustifolium TaxID=2727405 RepID=A0AAW2MHV4_9LAMI